MHDPLGGRPLSPTAPAGFAAVFPGQGAQYVGMGRDLAEQFPQARAVYERASAAIGFDVLRLCTEGPEEALRATANTQPAILVTSLACLATFPAAPEIAAGLSLGEYTALVCAGALRLEDAVRLVRLRGIYMEEATGGQDTMMVAVMGLTADQARALCAAHAHLGVVEVANFNSPGQIVIGGEARAVREAAAAAKASGARRTIQLAVSAPFHTSLMRPAAERLAADLERTPFRAANIPVVANVSATPIREVDDIRRALLAQVTSPVLWEQSVRSIWETGVRQFVEIGPGTTLCGMIRKTVAAAPYHIEDPASRNDATVALAGLQVR
ncbi:MAG TPA: ACP S-malonyltransferase [bacterium]|nr:ACP S-malonyltransferase [bacterium]